MLRQYIGLQVVEALHVHHTGRVWMGERFPVIPVPLIETLTNLNVISSASQQLTERYERRSSNPSKALQPEPLGFYLRHLGPKDFKRAMAVARPLATDQTLSWCAERWLLN